MSSFPAEFTVRAPRLEDAEEVARVVAAFDSSFGVEETEQAEDLLDDWRELDLERDAWVWERDGRIVAYGAVYVRGDEDPNRRLIGDGYVDPEHAGRGLGTAIIDATERRARERGFEGLENAVLGNDPRAADLLRARGYRDIRHFYRMRIELEGPPQAPLWPEGFEVSAFDPAEAREFHAALEEGFSQEWGHTPEPFEAFAKRRLEEERFDPTLWTAVRAPTPRSPRCSSRTGSVMGRRAGSARSRCASRGGGVGSARRCCSVPSGGSMSVVSASCSSASTPRIRPGRRGCTSAPV